VGRLHSVVARTRFCSFHGLLVHAPLRSHLRRLWDPRCVTTTTCLACIYSPSPHHVFWFAAGHQLDTSVTGGHASGLVTVPALRCTGLIMLPARCGPRRLQLVQPLFLRNWTTAGCWTFYRFYTAVVPPVGWAVTTAYAAGLNGPVHLLVACTAALRALRFTFATLLRSYWIEYIWPLYWCITAHNPA